MRNIFFYLLFIILFISCSDHSHNNWYIRLINGYEIWHTDENKIEIGLVKDYDNSKGLLIYWNYNLIGIPSKIIKFSIFNPYISAIVLPQESNNKKDNQNIFEEYYILDTIEQKVFGPMAENEYEKYIIDLSINKNEWIDTKEINEKWLEENGFFRKIIK